MGGILKNGIFSLAETRSGSLKFNFPELLLLRNKHAKYISCCAYVIVTQQFSIFKNFNKCQQNFLIFLARSFANYFVPNISCRYGSGPLLFEVLPAHWPFMPSLLKDLFIATCS